MSWISLTDCLYLQPDLCYRRVCQPGLSDQCQMWPRALQPDLPRQYRCEHDVTRPVPVEWWYASGDWSWFTSNLQSLMSYSCRSLLRDCVWLQLWQATSDSGAAVGPKLPWPKMTAWYSIEKNLVNHPPGFVSKDPRGELNFQLRDDSPAFALVSLNLPVEFTLLKEKLY